MKQKNRVLIILEEIFNGVTHGVGAILSILGLIALIFIAKNGGSLRMAGFIIFGASMIFMYLMSTLFHSLTFTKARKVFAALDQSAIFIFIASTYTPLSLLLLHGWTRITLLLLVWAAAILGVVFKSIFPDRFKIISVALYLLLGWAGAFIFPTFLPILSMSGVGLLLLGGIFYTTGIIFYAWKKLPFNHAIWHLFILSGTLCHYLIIYNL